jgi:hypothetical protein
MDISLVEFSSGDKIQNFELTFENPYQDVKIFLGDPKPRLIELLKREQLNHERIKVKLSLKCKALSQAQSTTK